MTGVRAASRTAAAALAAALALGGCSSGRAAVSDDAGYSGGAITEIAADRRAPAPQLSGTTLDGAPFDVADHRGKVVVVNTWGSWCEPCRREAPVLQKVWQARRGAGVQFVGLNEREAGGVAPARAFERAFGITYPSLVDEEGTLLLRLRDVPPTAVPSTLFLDRAGRVAARVIGPVTEVTLRAILDTLVREPSA